MMVFAHISVNNDVFEQLSPKRVQRNYYFLFLKKFSPRRGPIGVITFSKQIQKKSKFSKLAKNHQNAHHWGYTITIVLV